MTAPQHPETAGGAAGNPTRPVPNPGPYLKWPWPIQKVYYFDKRVQSFEDKLTQDYTADKKPGLLSPLRRGSK